MPGTKQGSIHMMETVIAKYGYTDDGKSALHSRAGKLGGTKSRGGGFYQNKELARRAGAIGGRISRRPKNV